MQISKKPTLRAPKLEVGNRIRLKKPFITGAGRVFDAKLLGTVSEFERQNGQTFLVVTMDGHAPPPIHINRCFLGDKFELAS